MVRALDAPRLDAPGLAVPGLDAPRVAVAQLARFVAGLEPGEVEPDEAADLFEVFAELTRLGTAAQTLLAPRVAEADKWRHAGHRSAASWMARASGTPVGDAVTTLETAERLAALPATREALRRGDLSVPQVREIVAAAVADPAAETELLDVADACSLESLRGYCRQVTAVAGSAAAEQERHAAVRRARFLRHRSGPGGVRGEFMLAPEDGARFVASIERRLEELADTADPRSARLADALVDLVTRPAVGTDPSAAVGTDPSGAARTDPSCAARAVGGAASATIVHLRVDATALRRGHVEHGEVCEIPGVGPVPVATARTLIPEAFLELLVTDGDDVVSVCHAGWGVPQHVRDALIERDPYCVVPGCSEWVDLEVASLDGSGTEDRVPEFSERALICWYHNFLKTYKGFTLRGGPVEWEWEPPPGHDSS